jgi:hypothetical protein
MTDSAPTDLLSRLGELRRALPEMRVGQLIANLAVVARGSEPGAIWEMEDEELLAAVNWQLAELRSRRGEQEPTKAPQPTGATIPISPDSKSLEAAPAAEL